MMGRRFWETIRAAFGRARRPRARQPTEPPGGDSDVETFLDEETTLTAEAPGAGLATTLKVGDLLSQRFRIVRFIGRGGIGEVYEAQDLRLPGERVAIKTLRVDRSAAAKVAKSLERELQLSRRVTSPSVCRVFDVGTYETEGGDIPYFSMELIEGETLRRFLDRRGRLTVEEALPIVQQMAAGLQAAHGAGIVHGDFKCSNVMLAGRGEAPRVVVTDFGLSRGEVLGHSRTRSSEGGRLFRGTLAYASPEQIRGRRLTPASDIYSLGIVVHEMVTGDQPYRSESPLSVAVDRLSNDPRPSREVIPSLDPVWNDAIVGCLRRDPEERFQSVGELLAALDLESPSGGAGPTRRTAARVRRRRNEIVAALGVVLAAALALIAPRLGEPDATVPRLAVLPFETEAGSSDDYLTWRVADDLVGLLSRLSSVEVVSLTSSPLPDGARVDPVEVGRAAGAAKVLVGAVGRSANELVIHGQLWDTAADEVSWKDSYRVPRDELVEAQRRLVTDVVESMGVEIGELDLQRLELVPTRSSEAYDLYAKGRFFARQLDEPGLRRALGYYDEAVAVDPRFADAFAATARAYDLLYYYGFSPADDALHRARGAAIKALEIDPGHSEAHVILGNLRAHDWDWSAAEASYRRAIHFRPGSAFAHHSYAICLAIMGRLDEAMAAMEKAALLDPYSPSIRGARGWLHYLRRDYDLAIRDLTAVVEQEPGLRQARIELAKARGQQGELAEATRLLGEIVDEEEGVSEAAAVLGYLYATEGRHDAARAILSRLLQGSAAVPPGRVAIVAGALGDADLAIRHLEMAYEQRDLTISFLVVEPLFDGLRGEPRFERLAALVKAGVSAPNKALDTDGAHRVPPGGSG